MTLRNSIWRNGVWRGGIWRNGFWLFCIGEMAFVQWRFGAMSTRRTLIIFIELHIEDSITLTLI